MVLVLVSVIALSITNMFFLFFFLFFFAYRECPAIADKLVNLSGVCSDWDLSVKVK